MPVFYTKTAQNRAFLHGIKILFMRIWDAKMGRLGAVLGACAIRASSGEPAAASWLNVATMPVVTAFFLKPVSEFRSPLGGGGQKMETRHRGRRLFPPFGNI